MTVPEGEFDGSGWHDCHIWGLEFRPGDPGAGDWTSDLALDIDFICEWLCGDNGCQFRVAPATLVFHGVEELKIGIDWGEQSMVHELSIATIERERTNNARIDPNQLVYRWAIKLNWPESGEISFTAVGFTQTLSAEPAVLDEQRFSRPARNELLGRFR